MFILMNLLFFTSCLKDPCTDVFCAANGECINGTCLCNSKYLGEKCENSYATYYAGSYEVFNIAIDTIIDTIALNVYNNSTDSITINNYAGLSNNLNVIAIVQNDSMINIFEQINSFELEDSIEQSICVSGTLLGKPTDTLVLSSIYSNGDMNFTYNRKVLKISN